MFLVLGGGGSPAPLPELLLEIFAALFVIICLFIPLEGLDWRRIPRNAWAIAALSAGVPILQLIPLPPQVWHALPSRDLEIQALALVGKEDSWQTWSMAPSRTLASLLSLGPPLLMLLVTCAIGRNGLQLMMRAMTVVFVGILVIGAMQLAGGESSPSHLYGSNEPWLYGFQANHNSSADVLLIIMPSIPVIIGELLERNALRLSHTIIMAIICCFLALLILLVVLTGSRMGMALLPIPIFATVWILLPWIIISTRTVLNGTLGVGLIAILGLTLASQNPTIQGILARFDFVGELRPQLWRDGFYVAQKYFPFGVGMGDFVPAFVAEERLEVIWPSVPNRAHNDYLELACEAGLVGLFALWAISFIVGRALWEKLRGHSGQPTALTIFAGSGLAILALHSFVDYPFRSMALACLGAFCVGVSLTSKNDAGSERNRAIRMQ